jgi:hypothetical protein
LSLSKSQRAFARNRAGGCCEYCLVPENQGTASFHVDHIRPLKLHGSDEPDNLCLACNECNNSKGPNISGYDPLTDTPALLFNPRSQVWSDHFRLGEDAIITGLTPEGRTTVDVLNLNDEDRVEWRQFGRISLYT